MPKPSPPLVEGVEQAHLLLLRGLRGGRRGRNPALTVPNLCALQGVPGPTESPTGPTVLTDAPAGGPTRARP
eukprot:879206-Alexandrium_andersonii.AAC.1